LTARETTVAHLPGLPDKINRLPFPVMQPSTREPSIISGKACLFAIDHHVLSPPLYRSMQQKHVDEFFSSGALRISSFRQFANHPDEQHRDTGEATAMATSTPVGGLQATVFIEPNRDALILCASLRSDQRSFTSQHYTASFRIDRANEFGMAVARCIPGVIGFLQGFCIYNDNRIMSRDIGLVSTADMFNPANPNLADPVRLQRLGNRLDSPTRFFMKEMRHQRESEYRLIWLLDHEAPDYIDLKDSHPNYIANLNKI
jgi:hypothetical protein